MDRLGSVVAGASPHLPLRPSRLLRGLKAPTSRTMGVAREGEEWMQSSLWKASRRTV